MNIQEFLHRIVAVKDKMYRFALRIVGEQTQAEDIVQEVYLKLWDKREQRHQIQNLEGYCMQIARNMSIDQLQRKGQDFAPIESVQEQPTSGQLSPQIVVEQRDTMQHLHKIIESLPEKQKMVLQLRDIEGMSYQEIADVLEISMEQVKTNLFRARNFIKKQLLAAEQHGL